MDDREKIGMLEELLERSAGSLTADTRLEAIEQWDSMASLSLIVLLEEKFQKTLSGVEIRGLQTVGDILRVME